MASHLVRSTRHTSPNLRRFHSLSPTLGHSVVDLIVPRIRMALNRDPKHRLCARCDPAIFPRLSLLAARSARARRTKQNLNLTLLCSTSATEPDPTFVSYVPGRLSLEWATPDACPRSGGIIGGGGGGGGGGFGFFGFIKFLFWVGLVGLVLYFAIGECGLVSVTRTSWDCRANEMWSVVSGYRYQSELGRDLAATKGGGPGQRATDNKTTAVALLDLPYAIMPIPHHNPQQPLAVPSR
jgi:hypothetical protein